jgi:uncharacterized membrane protein
MKLNNTAEQPRAASRPAPATRYGFVDLLRGYALVVMIETHVVNAYLLPELRHERFFFWLTFCNGLVAPGFLFASGFSALLQAGREWDDWLRFGPAFWRRMRRLGFITLVAYYTHLRGFRFSRYLQDEPGIWRDTFQVDILQCIVASLLVLHALVLILRARELFAWGASSVALGVMVLTPWVWAHDLSRRLPIALALFLSPHGLSFFPLFPWLSFVAAGSVAGYTFVAAAARKRELVYMRRAAGLAVLLVAGGLAANAAPLALPGKQDFYTTSPLYVLIRLGCVLAIMALLFLLERSAGLVPRAIRVAGQESLLVYGVHLWLIFAVLRGKHLGPILGLQAGYAVCFLASAAIVAAMLVLAGGWRRLKATHPTATRRCQAAVVAVMIVVFLLR